MVNIILIIVGAILTIVWGSAHLFATKGVVKDFGEISEDNKNIITMEWIIEGFTLIFVGLLVIIISLIDGGGNLVSHSVLISCSVLLFCLAILSLFTGARVNFIVFKLCPIIFTLSGVLILLGVFI